MASPRRHSPATPSASGVRASRSAGFGHLRILAVGSRGWAGVGAPRPPVIWRLFANRKEDSPMLKRAVENTRLAVFVTLLAVLTLATAAHAGGVAPKKPSDLRTVEVS